MPVIASALWLLVLASVAARDIFLEASQPSPQVRQQLVITTQTRLASRLGRPLIEFQIQNTASVPLAAWRVTVRATRSDGKEEVLGLVRDSYGQPPTRNESNGWIPANGTIEDSILITVPPTVTIQSAESFVAYAVFSDDTWVGDSEGVNTLFQHRQQEKEAWALIEAAMRLGRSVGGREGLQRALDYLSRPDQPDYDNGSKSIARRNLKLAIDGDRSITAKPDDFFRVWTDRAATRQEHLNRRGTPKGLRGAR